MQNKTTHTKKQQRKAKPKAKSPMFTTQILYLSSLLTPRVLCNTKADVLH